MKVIGLKIENVKRLKAVELHPNGESVVVGGNNGQGKSCVLDSILFALGGVGSHCEKPIRDGESRAEITIDLGDLVVTRRFTPSGSTLVVKNKDGDTKASPQAILDKLVGSLTFDPMEFLRLDAKEQRRVLAELAGVNTANFDMEFQRHYDERRDWNRRRDELATRLKGRVSYPDLPAAAINIDDLVCDYQKAVAINGRKGLLHHAVENKNRALQEAAHQVAEATTRVTVAREALLRAELALDTAKAKREQAKAEFDEAFLAHQKAPVIDIDAISKRISEADGINAKIRNNVEIVALQAEQMQIETRLADINAAMDKNSAAKIEAIKSAKYPLKGLAVSDDSVLFEGIPFKQINTAAQVKISTAMAIAQNPKLRVMLIRHGSDLDLTSLGELINLAAENDIQVWVERVGAGEECSVIIEDGAIKAK